MTAEKYYIDARGKGIDGPYTLDEARERAVKLGSRHGENVDGVRIFALHETVRQTQDEDIPRDYERFLPEQVAERAREARNSNQGNNGNRGNRND